MESVLLFILVVILLVRWVYLRERFTEIDQRIAALASAVHSSSWAPQPDRMRATEPVRPPEPMRASAVMERPAEAVVAPPVVERPAAPAATEAPRVQEPIPVAPPPPVADQAGCQPAAGFQPAPLSSRVTADQPRRASSSEWEAQLGGNWLNKIGVFLLVIGIALALAYSYRYLQPAGRDAISLSIGIAMLVSGVVFERRERYRVFSRGLIGGGWAALYFTVYAMQALAPARIIDNAWLGAILLLAVAAGMIVHSLRYRSETVTGMAYFMAFVTLAVTDVTKLSVIALIPLAASLLYVARKASWGYMAVFGLIATYVTCATRPDLGTPLWEAQSLFAIYWLLFEGFDLLCANPWLAPLNAVGFLTLSGFKWQSAAPDQMWQLLAGAAAAYLVSAILRARSNRWQVAATLTAGLAAGALFLKLDHQWIALGLLVEAELFYLAGVRFRAGYLRLLAAGLFGVEAFQLAAGEVVLLPARAWTPVAALSAVVFYANRFLRSSDVFYGYAAAAMAAVVAGFEAPAPDRAAVWLAMALAPFAFGWWRRLDDFRAQGYGLAILGLAAAAIDMSRLSLASAAAVSFGLTLCALFSPEDRLDPEERQFVRAAGSIITTVALGALLWRVLPIQYLGLGWMALALLLLELGLRGWPHHFRWQAYTVAALGALRVVAVNVMPVAPNATLEARLIPACAAVLAYAFAARVHREQGGQIRWFGTLAGTAFACDALWLLTPGAALAPASAAYMLCLLFVGLRWRLKDLQWEGYAMAAVAFAQCWYLNLEGGSQPVLAGTAVIVCLYAAQMLHKRDSMERLYCSLLATALATVLLYYQVSGSMRTVAWGIQGVALLAAGFPLRDRVMRVSGLGLLLACISKLFLWDLRHLETLPRIFSFIVLGLFLVGVSWIYTRFRERVAAYL